MKLMQRLHAKHDVKQLPELDAYTVEDPTPQADNAMIQYLLDSIAWLDELEDI